MSRTLPARPDLEHLRKQAKQLLNEWRREPRGAQLVDAQHALAQEYGFPSWPKLKAFVEAQAAASTTSPLVGRWQANVGKSTRHPDQTFTSAMLRADVSGPEVIIEDMVVDESGREARRVNRILADGLEHKSPEGHGHTLTATWREPRVLDTLARQHGANVGWGRYEVSADGATLTVTADRMRLVFDRM